jgi:hypothetical protein
MLSRCKTHLLMQRGQERIIGYGDIELRTLDVEECEVLNQALTLFLGSLPPLVGRGYLRSQAQNLLLS